MSKKTRNAKDKLGHRHILYTYIYIYTYNIHIYMIGAFYRAWKNLHNFSKFTQPMYDTVPQIQVYLIKKLLA